MVRVLATSRDLHNSANSVDSKFGVEKTRDSETADEVVHQFSTYDFGGLIRDGVTLEPFSKLINKD